MRCLGIESSCDETAFALVEDGRLKDAVLATQADMHALFGGVVPELASREHYRFCGALYDELMRRTGLTIDDIDVIAVSRGPGLLGSLLVGVAFAKGLALGSGARLLGICRRCKIYCIFLCYFNQTSENITYNIWNCIFRII